MRLFGMADLDGLDKTVATLCNHPGVKNGAL